MNLVTIVSHVFQSDWSDMVKPLPWILQVGMSACSQCCLANAQVVASAGQVKLVPQLSRSWPVAVWWHCLLNASICFLCFIRLFLLFFFHGFWLLPMISRLSGSQDGRHRLHRPTLPFGFGLNMVEPLLLCCSLVFTFWCSMVCNKWSLFSCRRSSLLICFSPRLAVFQAAVVQSWGDSNLVKAPGHVGHVGHVSIMSEYLSHRCHISYPYPSYFMLVHKSQTHMLSRCSSIVLAPLIKGFICSSPYQVGSLEHQHCQNLKFWMDLMLYSGMNFPRFETRSDFTLCCSHFCTITVSCCLCAVRSI